MKKAPLILVAGLVAAALFSGAASPKRSSPATLTVATSLRIGSDGNIEQQPGVAYTGPCLWTIDSLNQFSGDGTLLAGATASLSDCLVADDAQHITGLRVDAASPDLIVTITYQPQGVTFTATPTATSTGYDYLVCGVGPVYSTVPLLPLVAESNGGRGVQTTITARVRNPTGRSVRKASVFGVIGSYEPSRAGFCGASTSDWFAAGSDDAVWKTGL